MTAGPVDPATRAAPSEDGVARVLVIATVVLVAVRAAFSLGWPASGDMQVFLWLADLAAQGDVPYRDAFETKGPMAWLPLVPLVRVFGPVPWLVRAMDVVWLVAGTVAVGSVARARAGARAGACAAAAHAAWWSGLDWWNSSQPDAWAGTWIALACALALTRRTWPLVLAGACVGAAAMVKPFYAGFVIVPPLVAWGRAAAGGLIGRGATYASGIAVGIAVPLASLASMDALAPWLACLRWTATAYAGGASGLAPTVLASTIGGAFAPPVGLGVLLALGGLTSGGRVGRLPFDVGGATWLAGTLAVVVVQGRLWPYHWLPLLAPAAIWSAVALVTMARASAGASRMALVLGGATLAVAALGPAQQGWRRAKSVASPAARDAYQWREFGSYGEGREALLPLLRTVTAGASRDDGVLVWAFHPGAATLVGQRSGTRFAIMRPLFDGGGRPGRDSVRALFTCELAAAPPRWWVVPAGPVTERAEERAAWALDSIRALPALLAGRYRLRRSALAWYVYERLPDGAAPRIDPVSARARCADAWRAGSDPPDT